jgi:hypothetical protein
MLRRAPNDNEIKPHIPAIRRSVYKDHEVSDPAIIRRGMMKSMSIPQKRIIRTRESIQY